MHGAVSIVIAQELVPHRAGMAAGLMLGFSYGLGGLCTPITGYIADTYGVQMALNSTYPGDGSVGCCYAFSYLSRSTNLVCQQDEP